jgi:hypothetical protein
MKLGANESYPPPVPEGLNYSGIIPLNDQIYTIQSLRDCDYVVVLVPPISLGVIHLYSLTGEKSMRAITLWINFFAPLFMMTLPDLIKNLPQHNPRAHCDV